MSIIPYVNALEKWAKKKTAAKCTAAKMQAAAIAAADEQYLMRASRMSNCSDRIEYAYCNECGNLHIARTYLCRDRLCPVCAWRLSLKRTAELWRVFEHLTAAAAACGEGKAGYKVAMLTLTVRNCSIDQLKETLESMLAAWKKLLKRRTIQKHIKGYARSVEITAGINGIHPHIHAILVFDSNYNRDIKQTDFVRMWQESLGVEYTPVCDIRYAYSSKNNNTKDYWDCITSSVIEACKYAIKQSTIENIEQEQLIPLAEALKGKMLIGYGGIIREIRKQLKMSNNDDIEEAPELIIECPKCGNTNLIQLVYEWGTSSYLLGDIPDPFRVLDPYFPHDIPVADSDPDPKDIPVIDPKDIPVIDPETPF